MSGSGDQVVPDRDIPEAPPIAPELDVFRIPFIGLEVHKKTDLLALTAFILALGGIAYQVLGYYRGAEVELFAPEQILIVSHSYGDGKRYVRINSRMAYVNTGQPGFNATIRRESVQFRLGGTSYEQAWQAYQSFDAEASKLVPRFKSDASPVPVMAGSALSHETYFAPRPQRCLPEVTNPCKIDQQYLEWESFLKLAAQEKTLEFKFIAEIYGKAPPKQVRCVIDLSDEQILNLIINTWAAPPCI